MPIGAAQRTGIIMRRNIVNPGPTLGIISSTPKAPAAHIQKIRNTIPASENFVLCIAEELVAVLVSDLLLNFKSSFLKYVTISKALPICRALALANGAPRGLRHQP